jgi:hypothetical protein
LDADPVRPRRVTSRRPALSKGSLVPLTFNPRSRVREAARNLRADRRREQLIGRALVGSSPGAYSHIAPGGARRADGYTGQVEGLQRQNWLEETRRPGPASARRKLVALDASQSEVRI